MHGGDLSYRGCSAKSKPVSKGLSKGHKSFFFFLTLFQNNIKLKEKLQKQYEVLIPFIPVRPHVNILSHLLCYIFLICTYCCCCLFTRLCLTLCNPMAGSSVHKVSQASILEWVAIFFSRGSSQPRDQTHGSCVLFEGNPVGEGTTRRGTATPVPLHGK